MSVEVKFADFGEGIHEGEIEEWLVKVGDAVKRGQEIVMIHTEKMTEPITSPVDGTILSIEKEEGETIHVGDVLAKIEPSGGAKTSPEQKETPKQKGKAEDPSLFKPSEPLKFRSFSQVKQAPSQGQVVNERVLAAPAVRRRAREMGIDLRFVPGSGPAGRITRSDLEAYVASSAKRPVTAAPKVYVQGGEERIPLKGTRKTIAKAMRRSKDLAAHYTYFEEVDMSALDEIREQLRSLFKEKGVKVTYVALVMKLLVPVLRKYPLMNSSLDEETQEIVIHHDINIGISVDTPEGLIVPVVKHVDQKDIWTIASEVQDLAQRAREGKLKLADITGSTFTITSIGNIGGMMATPIINWPNVAILGLMRSKLRPVVKEINGKPEIVIRPIMYLSLSLDHRIVDGAVGARFTRDLIRYMENPGLVWLESS
ncbi:MAG: 2-oxo acid dehydrogenase subunit E2 [Methanobacteriota archaeon]|nr:MAG: 2-oxo acid dehydrogenase subunit E2 [Euryarchaeota archaeon]